MKLNRSQVQVFSLSFLDVLTCALGALIILFLIIPKYPPTPEQQQKLVQKLQAIIHSLKSENEDLAKTLSVKTKTKPTPSPAPTLFGLPLKANNAVLLLMFLEVWGGKQITYTKP